MLCRERHKCLVGPAPGGKPTDDVGGWFELEREVLASPLLDLAVHRIGGTEVGDGGRHQQYVAVGELPLTGLLQLGGGAHALHFDTCRWSERDVSRQERYFGSTSAGRLGERQAHAPRGAVAEEAHTVDRLTGAAGGDQYAQATPRSPARWPIGDPVDR